MSHGAANPAAMSFSARVNQGRSSLAVRIARTAWLFRRVSEPLARMAVCLLMPGDLAQCIIAEPHIERDARSDHVRVVLRLLRGPDLHVFRKSLVGLTQLLAIELGRISQQSGTKTRILEGLEDQSASKPRALEKRVGRDVRRCSSGHSC